MIHTRSVAFSAVALLTLLTGCDVGAPAATRAEFQQADSNRDGTLNREEYERLMAIRASGGDAVAAQAVKANMKYDTYSTRFKNADSNGDGSISDNELGIR